MAADVEASATVSIVARATIIWSKNHVELIPENDQRMVVGKGEFGPKRAESMRGASHGPLKRRYSRSARAPSPVSEGDSESREEGELFYEEEQEKADDSQVPEEEACFFRSEDYQYLLSKCIAVLHIQGHAVGGNPQILTQNPKLLRINEFLGVLPATGALGSSDRDVTLVCKLFKPPDEFTRYRPSKHSAHVPATPETSRGLPTVVDEEKEPKPGKIILDQLH
uniref:Uncharacterized protein n=1 Tax=Sphaerodactylus townsendi TaxID=933632 RepID=A0ACB8FHG0_9SAUR